MLNDELKRGGRRTAAKGTAPSAVVQNQANHKGLLLPSHLILEAYYAPLLGREDWGGEAVLNHIELMQEDAQDS